jgi:hypothetical protein
MSATAYTEPISPVQSTLPGGNREPCGKIYSRWDALPGQTQALFECGKAQSVFLTREWFNNLIHNSLDPSQTVRVFSVEDASRKAVPVLLLPACVERAGLFRPRTLSSLTNFYTPLFSPLLSQDCEPRLAFQTLAMMMASESPSWDLVHLRWLDKDAAIFTQLLLALKLAGFVVQTYFCSGNWYEPIRGRSYQQYVDGLRSSVRNIARSKARKVERSGRARIDIVAGGGALGPAIEAYESIYNSSWKRREPYPLFMPGLLRTFAAAGWLRLGLAYVDGQPAAAQVWFIANRTASIYKIAYDQKFKDLSIGSYLTMHMIRHAIEVEAVTEIDYLTGDDRYKQDWMSYRRERWAILAMNPRTPKGLAAIVRHVGGRTAKRALERWRHKRAEFVDGPGPMKKGWNH